MSEILARVYFIISADLPVNTEALAAFTEIQSPDENFSHSDAQIASDEIRQLEKGSYSFTVVPPRPFQQVIGNGRRELCSV